MSQVLTNFRTEKHSCQFNASSVLSFVTRYCGTLW